LVKQEQELVEQFNALERELRDQRRKQDDFAEAVRQQQAAHNHHVDEMAKKLRVVETEITLLKSPAA
jgi:hypothetical protein